MESDCPCTMVLETSTHTSSPFLKKFLTDRRTIANLPVMPLLDLLVIKTKGWWDYSISEREDYAIAPRW